MGGCVLNNYYLTQVSFYKNNVSPGVYHLGLTFRSRTELNRVYKLLISEPYTLTLGKSILGSRRKSYKKFPAVNWFPGEINFQLSSLEYNRFKDELVIMLDSSNIKTGLEKIDKILEDLGVVPIKVLRISDQWLGCSWSLKNYKDLI